MSVGVQLIDGRYIDSEALARRVLWAGPQWAVVQQKEPVVVCLLTGMETYSNTFVGFRPHDPQLWVATPLLNMASPIDPTLWGGHPLDNDRRLDELLIMIQYLAELPTIEAIQKAASHLAAQIIALRAGEQPSRNHSDVPRRRRYLEWQLHEKLRQRRPTGWEAVAERVRPVSLVDEGINPVVALADAFAALAIQLHGDLYNKLQG